MILFALCLARVFPNSMFSYFRKSYHL